MRRASRWVWSRHRCLRSCAAAAADRQVPAGTRRRRRAVARPVRRSRLNPPAFETLAADPPGALAGGEEEIEVVAHSVEIDEDAAQHVGRVFAAGVEAHGLADALGAFRLMDVSMQPDHRLVLLDDLAHSFAADRNYARAPAADDGEQRLVQLGREIEA